jgi:hypothetical protein
VVLPPHLIGGPRVLTLKISLVDGFDESTSEFVSAEDCYLQIEHSLVSLSKWEAKWEKAFLGFNDKTDEQTLDYIRMMIIGEPPSQEVFDRFSEQNYLDINAYINAKMSAAWFNETGPKNNTGEVVTSDLIYYWMIALGIPFECQHWHLNRLLTLVRVCNLKNAPEKKMSPAEIAARNRELNAQRRAEMKTRG